MTQSGGMLNKQLFLLDTKTYTWITNFQSNNPTTPTSTPTIIPTTSTYQLPTSSSTNSYFTSTSNSFATIVIVVCIVGSLAVLISVIIMVYFILKSRKSNKDNPDNNIIQQPSSNDYDTRFLQGTPRGNDYYNTRFPQHPHNSL